jgi:hypothetical protein
LGFAFQAQQLCYLEQHYLRRLGFFIKAQQSRLLRTALAAWPAAATTAFHAFAQILHQAAKRQNRQGNIKEITENDKTNKLVTRQNQRKHTHCDSDQDDHHDKNSHKHAFSPVRKSLVHTA